MDGSTSRVDGKVRPGGKEPPKHLDSVKKATEGYGWEGVCLALHLRKVSVTGRPGGGGKDSQQSVRSLSLLTLAAVPHYSRPLPTLL